MRRRIAVIAVARGCCHCRAGGLSFAAPNPPQTVCRQRGATAQSPVDVELVLAVDVSYSMDPEEQALQREGYMRGADLARIPAGAAARACTARSP